MAATDVAGSSMRSSSVRKRDAILSAARELFARLGVDRVSMDAVAAQAGVSKATVYNHFGDKQSLFLAIVQEASTSLSSAADQALQTHLGPGTDISTVLELEAGLSAAAVELGTTLVGSLDYAAVFALVEQQRRLGLQTHVDVETPGPEAAFAELLRHYAQVGLLDVEDADLAADHFTALTMLRAFNHQPDPASVDLDRVRQIVTDGVHVFLRAYGARPR